MYAKLVNVALLHSPQALLSVNHPVAAEVYPHLYAGSCKDSSACGSSLDGQLEKVALCSLKLAKNLKSFSVRIELREWRISYGTTPEKVPSLWCVSVSGRQYRLERPAGRYAALFASCRRRFEIAARVVPQLYVHPTTAYEELCGLLTAAETAKQKVQQTHEGQQPSSPSVRCFLEGERQHQQEHLNDPNSIFEHAKLLSALPIRKGKGSQLLSLCDPRGTGVRHLADETISPSCCWGGAFAVEGCTEEYLVSISRFLLTQIAAFEATVNGKGALLKDEQAANGNACATGGREEEGGSSSGDACSSRSLLKGPFCQKLIEKANAAHVYLPPLEYLLSPDLAALQEEEKNVQQRPDQQQQQLLLMLQQACASEVESARAAAAGEGSAADDLAETSHVWKQQHQRLQEQSKAELEEAVVQPMDELSIDPSEFPMCQQRVLPLALLHLYRHPELMELQDFLRVFSEYLQLLPPSIEILEAALLRPAVMPSRACVTGVNTPMGSTEAAASERHGHQRLQLTARMYELPHRLSLQEHQGALLLHESPSGGGRQDEDASFAASPGENAVEASTAEPVCKTDLTAADAATKAQADAATIAQAGVEEETDADVLKRLSAGESVGVADILGGEGKEGVYSSSNTVGATAAATEEAASNKPATAPASGEGLAVLQLAEALPRAVPVGSNAADGLVPEESMVSAALWLGIDLGFQRHPLQNKPKKKLRQHAAASGIKGEASSSQQQQQQGLFLEPSSLVGAAADSSTSSSFDGESSRHAAFAPAVSAAASAAAFYECAAGGRPNILQHVRRLLAEDAVFTAGALQPLQLGSRALRALDGLPFDIRLVDPLTAPLLLKRLLFECMYSPRRTYLTPSMMEPPPRRNAAAAVAPENAETHDQRLPMKIECIKSVDEVEASCLPSEFTSAEADMATAEMPREASGVSRVISAALVEGAVHAIEAAASASPTSKASAFAAPAAVAEGTDTPSALRSLPAAGSGEDSSSLTGGSDVCAEGKEQQEPREAKETAFAALGGAAAAAQRGGRSGCTSSNSCQPEASADEDLSDVSSLEEGDRDEDEETAEAAAAAAAAAGAIPAVEWVIDLGKAEVCGVDASAIDRLLLALHSLR
ncbi:chloroquine resistance marker related protein [Cyclospora cayetanensis]|uniref:Chloroquine resistance marker related protein n=1 Tax=Cyclospora cayetanensis TaxID=88456 RepID=A0A1D3CSH0_9EIME|nr:chloroquine resistance marker related protein [Cyclospora cayetanensis]